LICAASSIANPRHEPTADEVLEGLKKQRLKLKDDIAALLVKVERQM
jgi:uncharacterized protein YdcH (DUF465 family)